MPSDLSGGMRKRVALARSLALEPEVVLFDEPTTGLDPVTSATIGKLINSIQKELGVTSVVVTHDIALARRVGDRIAFLSDGKLPLPRRLAGGRQHRRHASSPTSWPGARRTRRRKRMSPSRTGEIRVGLVILAAMFVLAAGIFLIGDEEQPLLAQEPLLRRVQLGQRPEARQPGAARRRRRGHDREGGAARGPAPQADPGMDQRSTAATAGASAGRQTRAPSPKGSRPPGPASRRSACWATSSSRSTRARRSTRSSPRRG